MPDKHLSSQFDADLNSVCGKLLEMGGLVEKQVTDAIHALLDADSALAIVVQADDKKINSIVRVNGFEYRGVLNNIRNTQNSYSKKP